MESNNRFAPPGANVDDAGADGSGGARENAPALWNPNAAANWSVLFTPMFGAWLHMKNWQALGQPAKAAEARHWVIGSALLIFCLSLLSVLAPGNLLADFPRLIGLALLFGWYFASGRPHARFVAKRFGRDYPRKGWGRPLAAVVLGIVVYIVVVTLIALVARNAP